MIKLNIILGLLLVGVLIFGGCGGGFDEPECLGDEDCDFNPDLTVCDLDVEECVSGPDDNTAPEVEAGNLINAFVDVAFVLDGSAADVDGDDLSVEWIVADEDQAKVNVIDVTDLNSVVFFSDTGSYVLTLSVSDGRETVVDTVTATVTLQGGDEDYPNFPDWAKADIGSHVSSSVTDEGTGSVEFMGSGYDIWGASDSFSYFYTQVDGDFTITGKITSMQTPWDEDNPAYNWPKVGLMFRSELTVDSPYVFMGSTLSRLISQSRPTTSHQVSSSTTDTNTQAPVWLKLERVSDTFNAYYSTNGNSWVSYESYTMSSDSEIYVGLVVASKSDSITYTASFSDVVVEPSEIDPVCNTGSWTNDGCGEGDCANTLMRQTRTVSPSGCADNEQCVYNPSCASPSTGEWEQLGPGAGGWFRSVRFHEDNLDLVLMSGDQSGIHKSYDGGKTWELRSRGLFNFAVEDIAVSGDTAIIATMGGVYRSVDFGENWEYVWEDVAGPPLRETGQEPLGWIGSVHISKANPDLMFAGIAKHHPVWSRNLAFGVYRSTDGGDSWELSIDGISQSDMETKIRDGKQEYEAVLHFSTDPNNENIVYMGTRDAFYKSTNKGVSWTKIRNEGSWYSAVDPQNSNMVYTLDFASSYGDEYGQNVYKSTNGGSSWTRSSNGMATDASAEEIRFNPTNPNEIYIGIRSKSSNQIYKSTNGGQNWNSVIDVYSMADKGYHSSGVATSFDVNGDRIIFVPTLYLTENDGQTWSQVYTTHLGNNYYKGTGMELFCVEDIVFHPTIPGKMYMSVWDSGFWESVDYGESWKHYADTKATYTIERKDSNGNPYRCYSSRSSAVDKQDPNVIYVGMADNKQSKEHPDDVWSSTPGMITISRDGGNTWNEVPNLPERIIHNIQSFDNGNVFAFIEWNGLYKTTNKGVSWTHVSGGIPNQATGNVAADPRNENVLYYVVQSRGIWKSTSGGNSGTWTQKDAEHITNPVDVSVGLDGTVWVVQQEGSNRGVWKSTNGGDTFEKSFALDVDSEGFTAQDLIVYTEIIVDPQNPNIVYVAAKDHYRPLIWNGVGVYVTYDGGDNWEFLADGMYHKNVASLNIDENTGAVYAGVTCHSLFRYNPNE